MADGTLQGTEATPGWIRMKKHKTPSQKTDTRDDMKAATDPSNETASKLRPAPYLRVRVGAIGAPLSNQKGISLILIITLISFALLIYQSTLLSKALDLRKDWSNSLTFANKHQMIYALAEDLANEVALRFSRYSANATLQQCLTANPNPCNEQDLYDMALYAPIEQQSYQGGDWPAAPSGALLLAGGRVANVALFRETGQRCPDLTLTAPNKFCPLQAIIQFRPLCGGNQSAPELSVVGGGPCTGPANGVDITVGVARFMNGRLVYHQNTDPGGDARIFRFSANVFAN